MNSKYNILFHIILTISITISIFIISIKFVLTFKNLYYFDIKLLNISKTSNMGEIDIKQNYNYIINFLQNGSKTEFKIPTLKSSKDGIIHFIEVKNILTKLNYLFSITFIISLIGIILCIKHKTYRVFKWSGLSLLIITIFLAIPFIIDFNTAFTTFHKIAFRNNYWLFDPLEDPIINILPETFFFHCTLLILVTILLFSLCCILLYLLCTKSSKKNRPQSKVIGNN